jgi:uncharacterized protein with NRDE domain
MCLLVLAWQAHPKYRLIVAANRDEFHARPSRPMAPWDDASNIVGGRDEQAGGTWLAVRGGARFGAITNFRELGRRRRSAPSRGLLVPEYLRATLTPDAYLQSIEADTMGYAGFNLLLANRESLWYASNRADRFALALAPGIYALSNHFLDTPWPKLLRVRERFAARIAPAPTSVAFAERAELLSALLEILADREPAPPDMPLSTGLPPEWERPLSSPFVLQREYGTRCSTVVTIDYDDVAAIFERSFNAAGEPIGDAEHVLNG